MSKNIQVSLSPERVSLSPGETAEFAAIVQNTSDVVEAYSIDVQGVSPEWSKVSVTSVSLFPGDKETVRVQITPPISSSAKAGSYAVSVRVISKRDPAIGTIASFILDLGKMADYGLDLSPKRARGRKGPFQVAITNNGNITSTYKLDASDPEDMCCFQFKSDTVAVDPGTTKKVSLVVDPKKKPLTGAASTFSFTVKATPLEGEAKEVDGEFECRPLLPRWAVAAIALGVVALIALVVVLATRGNNLLLSRGFDFFDVKLAPGQTKVCEFKVDNEDTIYARVTWSGTANRFSVVLMGPNEAEKSHWAELSRQDGSTSPLDIKHALSSDDVKYGGRWTVYITNVSDNKDEGTVDISVANYELVQP